MSATCRRHDTECRRLDNKTTRRHPTCGAKAVTVKLSPGGTGPDGYIGHIITFVHRGPETLLTTLPCVDNDINDSPPLDAAGIKKVQGIVGSILYYARAVDNKLLCTVSAIGTLAGNVFI